MAIALACHLALLALHIGVRKAHVDVLVCTGSTRADQYSYRYIQSIAAGHGYDGQFYYAIAQKPWDFHGPDVDFPGARHLRILYPALCWLVSFGQPWLLAWAMPLINTIAIGCLARMGSIAALRRGLSPWWGLMLVLGTSATLPALRNLTDSLATLTTVGLIVAWLTRGPTWLILVWAAAAVFCREQNAALVAVIAVCALVERRVKIVVGLAVIGAFWLLWVGALRWHYGVWPFLNFSGNFIYPGAGLYSFCMSLFQSLDSLRTLNNAFCVTVLIGQIIALAYLISKPVDPALRLFALGSIALSLIVGPSIYVEIWSFQRVLSWVPAALFLCAVETRCRWPILLLLPGIIWPIGAIYEVF